MSMLCNDLILKIAEFDYTSRIYFTRKDWYHKWRTGIIMKKTIMLQRWYRKRCLKHVKPHMIWKNRGLIIRLYLKLYTGEYERFIFELPNTIINKQNHLHFIKDRESDIINSLAEAYEVFNSSEKKKSDVMRFLVANKLNAYHYNVVGV